MLKEIAGRELRIFLVDEAHVRADGDLHGMWVQRGADALVGSTRPRRGDKANDYVAVCLETGAIAAAQVVGTTTAATSVTELKGLREDFAGDLIVIWDNGPAQHGDAMRA